MSQVEFSCPEYRAIPGSRRCEHYNEGGTCRLPDRFLCVEWERANARRVAGAPRLRVIAGGKDQRADAAQRGWDS